MNNILLTFQTLAGLARTRFFRQHKQQLATAVDEAKRTGGVSPRTGKPAEAEVLAAAEEAQAAALEKARAKIAELEKQLAGLEAARRQRAKEIAEAEKANTQRDEEIAQLRSAIRALANDTQKPFSASTYRRPRCRVGGWPRA